MRRLNELIHQKYLEQNLALSKYLVLAVIRAVEESLVKWRELNFKEERGSAPLLGQGRQGVEAGHEAFRVR